MRGRHTREILFDAKVICEQHIPRHLSRSVDLYLSLVLKFETVWRDIDAAS